MVLSRASFCLSSWSVSRISVDSPHALTAPSCRQISEIRFLKISLLTSSLPAYLLTMPRIWKWMRRQWVAERNLVSSRMQADLAWPPSSVISKFMTSMAWDLMSSESSFLMMASMKLLMSSYFLGQVLRTLVRDLKTSRLYSMDMSDMVFSMRRNSVSRQASLQMRSRMEAAMEDRLVLLSFSTFSISFTFITRLFRCWFFSRLLKIFKTEYFFTVLSLTRKVYSILTTSSSSLLLSSSDSQASLLASIWTMPSLLLIARFKQLINSLASTESTSSVLVSSLIMRKYCTAASPVRFCFISESSIFLQELVSFRLMSPMSIRAWHCTKGSLQLSFSLISPPHFFTSSSFDWNICMPASSAALDTPTSGSTISAFMYLSIWVRLDTSMMSGMVLREFLLKLELLWWMSFSREDVTMQIDDCFRISFTLTYTILRRAASSLCSSLVIAKKSCVPSSSLKCSPWLNKQMRLARVRMHLAVSSWVLWKQRASQMVAALSILTKAALSLLLSVQLLTSSWPVWYQFFSRLTQLFIKQFNYHTFSISIIAQPPPSLPPISPTCPHSHNAIILQCSSYNSVQLCLCKSFILYSCSLYLFGMNRTTHPKSALDYAQEAYAQQPNHPSNADQSLLSEPEKHQPQPHPHMLPPQPHMLPPQPDMLPPQPQMEAGQKQSQKQHRQQSERQDEPKVHKFEEKSHDQREISEIKVNEVNKYFEDAEKRRQVAFEQIGKFMDESLHKFKQFSRQLQESAEVSQLKGQLQALEKDKKNLQLELDGAKLGLGTSKQICQQLHKVVKQMKAELESLKMGYGQREEKRKVSVASTEAQYKQLEEAFSREQASAKQIYQQHLKKVDSENKLKITQLNNKLSGRIGNQSIFVNQLQQANKVKQQLQRELSASQAKILILQKDLQIRKEKERLFDQKQQDTESRISEKYKQVQKEVAKFRQAYLKKTQKSQQSYKNIQKSLKQSFQRQKNMLTHQAFGKVDQLEKKLKNSQQSRKFLQQKIKSVQADSIKLKGQLQANLSKKRQQISNYQTIIKQINSVLNSFSASGRPPCSDKKLPSRIEQCIELANKQKEKAASSEREAIRNMELLVQVCQQNKALLKAMQGKLKTKESLETWLKFTQVADDSNHLGVVINSIIDKLKVLFSQLSASITSKQSAISGLKTQNSAFRREEEVNQKLLQENQLRLGKLNKQYDDLQLSFQTEKSLNVNLQREAKESKEKLCKLSFELMDAKSMLKVITEASNAQLLKTEEQRSKMQEEKLQSTHQLNAAKQSLSQQLDTLKKQVEIRNQLNKRLNNDISILNQKIKRLQLTIRVSQAELEKQQRQMQDKERILKTQFDQSLRNQIGRISEALESVFGKSPQTDHVEDIISFLHKQTANPTSSAFTVSHILQNMPKQRSFLLEQCCKFLEANNVNTKLSFKYDQFNKNFVNYLPTPQNKFLFAVLLKTKKNVVFGVVSSFIGRQSKAFAFNLTTMKIMHKSVRTKLQSTAYESSMLKFGNDEIVIRNNSSLEIKINTMIIGERYFEFLKEDLVGKEEELVALQAMEIHRLVSL